MLLDGRPELWQGSRMPRTARSSAGNVCYHVINRGNGGATLFQDDDDFVAFMDLLAEARQHLAMRLLGWCVMPNHIHLVLWPYRDGDLGRWMQWLLTTHVRRHHRKHASSGHLWEGRFRAFPIQRDDSLFTVLRYVESNPSRAGLTQRARSWPWSSLARRLQPIRDANPDPPSPALPDDWLRQVERPLPAAELERVRLSVRRGAPFGSPAWVTRTVAALGLESSLRPVGRPRTRAKRP